MANLELKTASGGSVTLVPEDGVSNVTATVKHESGVLASEAQVEQAEFLTGSDRTWQNVTASRASGVTYTNNTGRDILVAISINTQDSTIYSINGVELFRANANVTGAGSCTSFIVPNGATYSSSRGFLFWAELR